MTQDEPSPKTQRISKVSGVRPLAMLSCTVRRHHEFVPSRRLEGYDTCFRCGYRRKASDRIWFAASRRTAAPPTLADPGAAGPAHPDDSEVVVAFDAGEAPAMAKGVDPRILRDFLRQIDTEAPRSGGARGRRGAQAGEP